MRITRNWAMPSPDTFSIPPIEEFVARWLAGRNAVIDPFARNSMLAHYRNDLNPNTSAEYHMDAVAFLGLLREQGVMGDALLFDPPYSPRQISECYQGVGRECGMAETQSGRLYRTVRDAARDVLLPGAVALSFGWNTTGMGGDRGFHCREILIVCHGGAHNDTLCTAEVHSGQSNMFAIAREEQT